MVRTRVLFVAVLALFVAGHAWAQDVPAALTLQEALQLARSRNPALAGAASEVDVAEADRNQATRRLNPALTVASEGYPLFEPSPRPPFRDGQELTIRYDQEIEMGGRRDRRSEAAVAGIAVARSFLDDQRRRVDLAVQRAYLQVVLAKTDREVSREALADIDRVLGITKARLDQGEISGGELRRLQVERLRFVDDQFATELALKNAKAALLAIMGFTDLGRDFDVTGVLTEMPTSLAGIGAGASIPAFDRAALERQALAARPDLLAARGEELRADSQTQLQRALATPNITVGGGYKRTQTSDGVAFAITMPLQFFNRNPGGIARAEAERRRAASLTAVAEAAVRLDVQQAVNAIEINQARVRYIEQDTLTAAREARDAIGAAYQIGEAGLIDYLDAQRSFRETLRIYNRALYERRISDFEVAAAIGAPPVQP